MELAREITRDEAKEYSECSGKQCEVCSVPVGCKDIGETISMLGRALLAEMDKPKVWTDAPEWAKTASVMYSGDFGRAQWGKRHKREPPKSRIDEIAEEYSEKSGHGSQGIKEIIKSAILRALEDKEANR